MKNIVLLALMLASSIACASSTIRDQNIRYCEANFPRMSDLHWNVIQYLTLMSRHNHECVEKYSQQKWAGKCDPSTHRCAP